MYSLLPLPQQIEYQTGEYHLKSSMNVQTCTELGQPLEDLFSLLREKGVTVAQKDTDGDIVFLYDDAIEHEQGYILRIARERITIHASGKAGLFYGLQTLRQILLQSSSQLAALTVWDEPLSSIRGMLVDLRFQTYYMDYLIEKIKTWAYYKLNYVTIEYSNHFPYQGKYQVLRSDNCFTEEEIEKLVSTAKAYHITVVPIVQTFGHMEFLLSHPDFDYLNENHENRKFFSQCCPLHPEILSVITELLLQSYVLHGKPTYLNIGCDEALHLGECSVCETFLREKENGKGILCYQHVNAVIATVNSLGATPVLFGDMVLAYPELFHTLDKRCVIGDWDYNTVDFLPPRIMDWQKKSFLIEEQVLEQPSYQKIAEKHWIHPSTGDLYPFGHSKYCIEQGIPVLGHPSTICVGPSDMWTPNYTVHIGNISAFSKAIQDYGGLGIVNTAWEHFLMETVSYGIATGAELGWSGTVQDSARENRFTLLAYGVEMPEVISAMYLLSQPVTSVEKKWPRVYIPEEFGRKDIPPEELLGNTSIDENISTALEVFSKATPKRNRQELEHWIFGAKIKQFWRMYLMYQVELSQQKNTAALRETLHKHYKELNKTCFTLLQDSIPENTLQSHFDYAFTVYLETKETYKEW